VPSFPDRWSLRVTSRKVSHARFGGHRAFFPLFLRPPPYPPSAQSSEKFPLRHIPVGTVLRGTNLFSANIFLFQFLSRTLTFFLSPSPCSPFPFGTSPLSFPTWFSLWGLSSQTPASLTWVVVLGIFPLRSAKDLRIFSFSYRKVLSFSLML